MAKKRQQRRVEPTFDAPAPRRASDLSVSEEDRVVPSTQKAKQAASKRKASRARKSTNARKSGNARKGGGARRRGGGRRGGFGLLRLLRGAVYWSLVLCLWGGIAAAGIVAYYGAQMPSAASWAIPNRPPNVRIEANDGRLIANRGMTGGQAVGLHEMSPSIPQAVVAIEDRRFYSHFGVDLVGMARAMVENLMAGHFSQGGSTITQQLAKNMFLTPDRTIKRKVQEMLLALWLEHEHSKDQILEMYLNRMYFGSGAYGVEAASRRYFNKPASKVTLSEAALLAGLLKAPSRLSPARDPDAAEQRAQLVLAAMRDEGMIGERELTTAMSAPATRAAAYWTGSEHYVADRVMEELPDLIGDVGADIVVETTVDLGLQKVAEKAIRRLIDENRKARDVSQGALVSLDGSGAVRALVGGYDYAHSQFDRVLEARRQPGSAFKPFVYMAAMESGLTPESVRNDAPVRIGKWTPENYGDKYYGRVTLETALAKSLNSVAAQLVMEVGPPAVVEVAHRLGIVSDLRPNASIALGTSEVTPMELTAAYVPFANGGYRPRIHLVRRITTDAGKVLYRAPRGNLPRVVNARVVGMMNAMMHQTVAAGTGHNADFGWPAAGKTGTSQKSRDAWFVGYTANLVTGVWFGNDDGHATNKVTGGTLPARAWHDFMAAAHKGVPVRNLPGDWRPRGPALADTQSLPPGQGQSQGQSMPRVEHTGASGVPVPPRDVGTTSSIRRSDAQGGERRSILDIILGR